MDLIGILLTVVGSILTLVGWVSLVIKAFRKDPMWGVGTLFLLPVGIVFACKHWRRSRKPFLFYLGGLALCSLGLVMLSI